MDWLFPSIKNALFPAKSTSAIASISNEIVNEAITTNVVVDQYSENTSPKEEHGNSPIPKTHHHQSRRRSSLSDLDTLLKKESQRLSHPSDLLTIGEYGPADRRQGRVWSLLLDDQRQCEPGGSYPLSSTKGGSFGDMINLKLYGSNRSLVSGTSSIAETVPLETIQRKKTVSVSLSASRVVNEDACVTGNQEDVAIHPESDMMSGRISLAKGDDDPLDLTYSDDIIIVEEDEMEDLARPLRQVNDKSKQTRTPSITERAERLSQLIRSRQGRAMRYVDEVDITVGFVS